MPLNAVEQEIVASVAKRFFVTKQPTGRRPLILEYKDPDVLEELCRRGYLKDLDRKAYLPALRAFEDCGDPDIRRLARESTVVVLRTLQSLFETEDDKTDFKPEDVEARAREILGLLEPDVIGLGLYLAQELGVFSQSGTNLGNTELTFFRISENIVRFSDLDKEWDKHVAKYADVVESVGAPNPEEFGPTEEVSNALPVGTLGDWSNLHRDILEVAQSRFDSGHFADAAEAALKRVNERVRQVVKERTGDELDGAALMNYAFSLKKPVLVLDDLETKSGRDIQLGYMQIFAGAMTGIRNPKAHGNIRISPVRAIHFLYLASLLMSKVDEAIELEQATRPPLSSEQ